MSVIGKLRSTITHSQVINCSVVIVREAAVHSKCSKYTPLESVHVGTRLIVECRTLSEVPSRLQVAWQASKNALVKSLFLIAAECPHR